MLSDRERWNVPPESRRIAHPQKIYLRYRNSNEFVQEYLVDLSMTGMFVRCLNPAPPGTVFDFRMRLASGRSKVEGKALVVWVRNEQQSLSLPEGMGVRFLDLDEASFRQIRSTVERYAQDPESPGEINTLRSVVEETLGELLGPDLQPDSGHRGEMKRSPVPIAAPPPEIPVTPEPRGAPPEPSPQGPSSSSLSPPAGVGEVASAPERKAPWGLLLVIGVALLVLLLAVWSLR